MKTYKGFHYHYMPSDSCWEIITKNNAFFARNDEDHVKETIDRAIRDKNGLAGKMLFDESSN